MDIVISWFASHTQYLEDFLKLFIAAILGGLIGYQRENSHRPAGLRTHILVCVGSALVMTTSQYIFRIYQGQATLDPARLGAQVISGIGFLGAGTILRDGSTIKGLTTAAGLWAVSCIGIAIGAGFYSGGISAAILVYITLIISKDREPEGKNGSKKIVLLAENSPNILAEVEKVLFLNGISVRCLKMLPCRDDSHIKIHVFIGKNVATPLEQITKILNETQGIIEVK